MGFRREGIERQAEWLYDRFVEYVTYSALASEWPRRHS
jgi:RimJ/RimL family protein N-acetyltransferase